MTNSLICSDESDTISAGVELSESISKLITKKSVVVFLEGDLGAGKTTFTKGILKGLGYGELVKSPTFNLVEIHEIDECKIFHFDLYRINEEIELEEIGLDEYLQERKAVCIFEWPKIAENLIPKPDFHVSIAYTSPSVSNDRKIVIS
tara:strand:+ start:782 stop:1225 length:444 start_codon:yes stop_codon:yes gene_type:complete